MPLPSSATLDDVKRIDSHSSDLDEFVKAFAGAHLAIVENIATASRIVQHRAARDELQRLVTSHESSEQVLQRHLAQNPWMWADLHALRHPAIPSHANRPTAQRIQKSLNCARVRSRRRRAGLSCLQSPSTQGRENAHIPDRIYPLPLLPLPCASFSPRRARTS